MTLEESAGGVLEFEVGFVDGDVFVFWQIEGFFGREINDGVEEAFVGGFGFAGDGF